LTEENVITIENVSYRYPKASNGTLRNINLEIKKGEFVVVMGPAGAGKTTLCLLLNGIIPQLEEGDFRGKVTVLGKDTLSVPVQELACEVGIVFQDPESQRFGALVHEDVAFGPSNLGMSIEDIAKMVKRSLSAVKLQGFEERETDALSGGEKQRLAMAGVLAMNPSILVLDEPTSELDPVGTSEILDVIAELRDEREVTVILVSHKTDAIASLADRIVVINEGRIAADGTPGEILTDMELLRSLSIQPPQVTEVFSALRESGHDIKSIPYKTQEAIEVFKSWNLNPGCTWQTPPTDTYTGSIIRVENLRHVYPGNIEALKGINLDVRRGEFLAIIGQNGSGKSTLVKHFNGLLKPTGGRVLVDGVDSRTATVSELAQTVGYVFQNPDHQIFEDSVEKEIAYGPKNHKVPKDEINRRVKHVLKMVGLEGYEEEYPFTLGKGERQRIAVAAILATQPEVLIVDEPTTGQDWRGKEGMMKLIKDLHSAGHTIITITHDMDLVARFAERVVVLRKGEIVLVGTPTAVFEQVELLRETFLEPPPVAQFAQSLGLGSIVTIQDCVRQLDRLLRAG